MEYLIRFVHVHESFRKAEIEALAELRGVDLEFVQYQSYVGPTAELSYFLDSHSVSVSFLHCQSCLRGSGSALDLEIHPGACHLRALGQRRGL